MNTEKDKYQREADQQKVRTSEAVKKLEQMIRLQPGDKKQDKKRQLEDLLRSEKERRKLEKELREERDKMTKLNQRLQDEICTSFYCLILTSNAFSIRFIFLDI